MPQYTTRNSRWLIGALSGALLLGGAAACDDNNFNAIVILASGIAVATGSDDQIGTVNQPLPNPIVVHVTDVNGNSAPNSIVIWNIASGGGSVSSNSLAHGRERERVGRLDAWTDGWRPDASGHDQLGRLSSDYCDRADGRHYRDDHTRRAATPRRSPPGATSAPMVVTILDLAGNPIANAAVTWSSSGGTLECRRLPRRMPPDKRR